MTARWRSLLWSGALALLGVTPLIFTDFNLFRLELVAIYAIVMIGLNLLTGYNGQFSLGHGAFFAAGAYVTAAMSLHWNTPYWFTIPVAGLIAGGLGFLFGLPAVRLSGLYLTLATFAVAIATPQVLKKWTDLTNGSRGILLTKPEAPFNLGLTSDQWLFCFCAAWAFVLFVLARNLLHSPTGRAFVAIRDSEVAASLSGVAVARFKTLAFSISAAYAGIAGGLDAVVVGSVFPDSFPAALSVTFVIGMVVGGIGTLSGPLLGAFFVEFLPVYTQQISKAAPGVIYGLFLILSMLLMPAGLAGALARLYRLLRRRASRAYRSNSGPGKDGGEAFFRSR